MLDSRWYEGREQALVKHTFLDAYMPAQIPKIVSWADTFCYVDLFAGPWQSQSGDYSDTSFGIALKRMSEAKAKQAELGRFVRMVAHLVEKDPKNHAELVEAVIYLTRHPAGIRVFRDAHRRALETQSAYRTAKKAKVRKNATGMDDLFAQVTVMEPGERSAKAIADGEAQSRTLLLQRLGDNAAGLEWKALWPPVLDACVVTYGALGDIARELWSSGQVEIPVWQSKAVRRPKDEFHFRLPAAG